MNKLFALILVCLITVSCLAGCTQTTTNNSSSGSTSAQPIAYNPNEEEYYCIDSNTDVADAFDTVWWNDSDLCRLMLFDRLLQCDKEGNPVNDQLTESHSISPDGLTNTFVIRDNVKWHDGKPFTAEDIVWSIKTALKATKINPNISDALLGIEGASSFAEGKADSISGITVNGKTITIKLSVPNNMFLMVMSKFAPLPKHLLENETPATIHTSKFWQHPIGTGAYKFNKFVVGEYFEFVRNDDYYGAKAAIQHVKALIISSSDYIVKTQANELDYCQTRDPATIEEILKNKNYSATLFPVVYSRQFSFNTVGYKDATNGTAVSDIRVRQALNYALDKPAICKAIYGDYATPVYTRIAPNIPGYNDDVEKYGYNPEKAKALLKDAGYDFSHTLRILEYWGDPTTHDLLDLIVNYFGKIGIKCEYFTAGQDATAEIYTIKDYDLCLEAVNSGAARNLAYSVFTKTSPGKAIRGNAETDFDKLYSTLCKEPDFVKQSEILKQLQKTEEKYCWHIPLCTLKYFAIVNKAKFNVTGVNLLGDGFNYDRGFDKLSFNADYFKK